MRATPPPPPPPPPSATSLITVHGYGQLQHTGLSPTPVGFARVSPPLCVYDEEKPKGGKILSLLEHRTEIKETSLFPVFSVAE